MGDVINYKEALKSSWGAKEVREARRKANLTLKELSSRLGISLRMLQYYEAGKTPVSKYLEDSITSIINDGQPNKEEHKSTLEPSGTLTDFDIQRIKKLREGIQAYLDDHNFDYEESHVKMMNQSYRELGLLLSKFDL